MSFYTKKGYRLEYVGLPGVLSFRCDTQYVSWNEGGLVRGTDHPVAVLQIIVPCDQGQIVRTLRAWLGAYDDDDLLAHVEPVVTFAYESLRNVAAPDPAAGSQVKGMN